MMPQLFSSANIAFGTVPVVVVDAPIAYVFLQQTLKQFVREFIFGKIGGHSRIDNDQLGTIEIAQAA